MEDKERRVTFYAPQKTYTGQLDISGRDLRTIDLLNSANIFWKNPAEKCFQDSIKLHKVTVTIGGGQTLGTFANLQLRLSDIVFFTDELDETGNATEKKRATTLTEKSGERTSTVRILTKTVGNSFFIITGTFAGLFKSKSMQRFLPMMHTTVNTISRHGDKWTNEVLITDSFIGLATEQIEAASFQSNP